MIKVLFVCMGNICRSPTAEAVFRHHVRQAGLEEGWGKTIYIDSAGTHGFHIGAPPDKRSQAVARRRGVDLSPIRSRQLEAQDFTDFDYILAMDRDNLEEMQARCSADHHTRLDLLLNHAPQLYGISEVPDPYYGPEDGFDRVYDVIEQGSLGLLDHIRARHQF